MGRKKEEPPVEEMQDVVTPPEIGEATIADETPLQPTVTITDAHQSEQGTDVTLAKGQVYMIELDKGGNEIAGTGAITTEKQFDKTFSKALHDNSAPKFSIKKKYK